MIKIIVLFLTTCLISNVALSQHNNANQEEAMLINSSANFYQVNSNLFRSEQPIESMSHDLDQLNIKTIVNLRFFDRDDDIEVFSNSAYTLINKPLLTWSISTKEIADILATIKRQQEHGAVLVHCYHGSDRTGLIIAMYRIVYDNWSIEQAKEEMVNGPYRFSPFWVNITDLLTDDKVNEVKKHLETNKSLSFVNKI